MPHLASSKLWSTLYRAVVLSCCIASSVAAPAIAQNTTTVTNVFQNHYRYGYTFGSNSCPTGLNIPTGQYSSAYHLERGHAIHHLDPVNSVNDYWVYWAHFDSSNYGVAEVAVFKSTSQCGPYILQTNLDTAHNTDGSGYGFQPGGWQSRDENIFNDSATQTYNPDGSVAAYASSYLVTASNSLNTVQSPSGSTCGYANDSLAIFKMTPDYLGIDTTTSPSTNGANWAFVCAQREAPVLFRQGSGYFLIGSQAAGWYPSQGGYGFSSNALTGYTPTPINLGNSSTFGGQTSDGFVIQGTQASTYMLTFDHLGGDDSKNPAWVLERRDTGGTILPVILDSSTGTATLNWLSSFTVDNVTGVLSVPTLTNLTAGVTAKSTVLSANATSTPPYAVDQVYTTRWNGSLTGASAFTATAAPVSDTYNGSTTTLCPITGATATTKCNPSLITDLGSVQPIQEIDLSFYMVKGSEPYYNYKVAYSSDNANWTTLDFSSFAQGSQSSSLNASVVPFNVNNTYGFNFLNVNFSARYVAVIETNVVQSNSTNPFYAPNLFEMAVIKSNATATPAPVTVNVVPSTTNTSTSNSFTVQVNVTAVNGNPTPSGFIQLSAPGFTSETYGLVSGANNFTVPGGTINGGTQTITVGYRPDPISAPTYGLATTNGTATIYIDVPVAPTNLAVTASSPATLTLNYTAATGASSYVIYRSVDGGTTYTQLASTSAVTYGDGGLTNGSSYCYQVASVNSTGTGTPSAGVCATASANFPVTNVAVTPTAANALTITYTAVTNATSYIIKRSVSGGAYSQLAAPTGTTYTDTSLPTGTNYCYTVAAVFASGTAQDSSPVCATSTTNFPATNITVTPSTSTSLIVAYSAVNNATSYVIKRSVAGGAYTQLATPSATSYTDAGLTNNVNYCYTVAAVFPGGTGPDSAGVCATATNTVVPLTVTNFGFETPATTTYIYNPTGGTWTFVPQTGTTGSGVATNNSGFTSGDANAPQGTQIGFIQNTAYIYQTISGLTVGQTYKLIVAASQRQNKSGGQIGQVVDIRVDNTTISTISPPQAAATYGDYSATFTATATSHRIGFYGTNALATGTYPDNCLFVDNIRLLVFSPGAATSSTPQYVWVVNGVGTVTRADSQANTVASGVGTAGTTSTYGGLAIDSAGGVWSVSSANNALSFTSKTGASPVRYTSPALNAPAAIAVDGVGTVWVANSGSTGVSSFTAAGALRSTVVDSTFNGQSGIAIDQSGSIWISNANGNTIDEIIGGAAPIAPLATAATTNTPGARP